MSGTTWDLAPLPVVAAAVALALFAGGFLRLRRRAGARYADGWRVPLFVLAIALATLPVISPLDQAGDEYLLSAHMLQHVLLGDAAPALALVALRGPLLFFVLPAPILRHLGHRRLLRGTLAFLLRPSVSLAVWALVIGAWHIPAAYDYRARSYASRRRRSRCAVTRTRSRNHRLAEGASLRIGKLRLTRRPPPSSADAAV
jgi:putative membrane protein